VFWRKDEWWQQHRSMSRSRCAAAKHVSQSLHVCLDSAASELANQQTAHTMDPFSIARLSASVGFPAQAQQRSSFDVLLRWERKVLDVDALLLTGGASSSGCFRRETALAALSYQGSRCTDVGECPLIGRSRFRDPKWRRAFPTRAFLSRREVMGDHKRRIYEVRAYRPAAPAQQCPRRMAAYTSWYLSVG